MDLPFHPLNWLVHATAHLGIQSIEDLKNATGEQKKKIDAVMYKEAMKMALED